MSNDLLQISYRASVNLTVTAEDLPDETVEHLRQAQFETPATATHYPTVTIVIPTFNEAAHIERVITGFLQTHYPHLIEILVVDGGSSDGTQAIVQRLAALDSRVRLLHNPLKIQSAGLNIGIAMMRGDVFIRADGHSLYAPEYIERCVETLRETQALNVGGIQRFAAATAFQAGTALAAHSILGNGGSKHRRPDHNGPSDTVFLGCWWKRDFDRLDTAHLQPTPYYDDLGQLIWLRSYFDLDQVTNQDSEINVRFRKASSQAIFVSSRIHVWYFPRKSWKGLRKQYFNYGRGRCRTAALHPDLSPQRAKLPLFAGFFALFVGLLDRFFLRGRLRTKQLFFIASFIPWIESLRVTLKHRHSFEREIWRGQHDAVPSLFQRWWYCSVALWTMTPAYFIGYVYQLVRRRVFHVEGW